MSNDPVLATVTKGRLTFKVYGGLHYIRGNSAPYFSLTCWGRDHGSEFGGASHETILEHCPQFADLAALHMSDHNGIPTYAAENGFYHLGGSRSPKNAIWRFSGPNWKHAADYFRITEEKAKALVAELFGDHYSETGGFLSDGAAAAAKARLADWVETQKPRWKAEAEACIAKHGLVVYGDQWKRPG